MDSSTSNNELFICFASRLSSSSMKISSSKSILSPRRVRDPPNTLPTSLSRRLRTNGSIKGGQASPMFPTGAKKRASTFENPEPSSPKVTCIGQVRVKTKNKGRKLRTLSRKQSAEMSFRKLEQHQGSHTHNQNQLDFQNQPTTECLPQQKNQRWVHLPVTICDAFSCLFPCKSSCFSTSEREDKTVVAMSSGDGLERQSSCPEVFARWLVAVQEGEGEGSVRERDIVNEGEMRSSRRHIFDELEISDEICEGNNEDLRKTEEGRISVSVPPKNALLLMRCRSDPNKMAALANRFWESPVVEDENQDEEEKEKDEEEKEIEENNYVPEQVVSIHVDEQEEEQQSPEAESVLYVEIQNNDEQVTLEQDLDMSEELLLLFQETDVHRKMDLDWENASEDRQTEVNGKDVSIYDIEEEERSSYCSSTSCSITSNEESEESALCSETESAIEKVAEEAEREKTINKRSDSENTVIYKEEEEKEEKDGEGSLLPDCLLMMMCEPKLSMEVSKETWVCSTDFIRRRPKKVVKQTDGGDGDFEKVRTDTDPGEALQPPIKTPPTALTQPPRSSCSFPASNIAMAAMIEQKLVNAVAYEPFVLTRCQSAPLRSAPDSCFWKNRNLEPHRHSNFGVGAAGIGF